MKVLLLLTVNVFLYLANYSQSNGSDKCWKVSEERTNKYLDELFMVRTGTDPNLSLIKINFIEAKMIYIVGIQPLRQYCKDKYQLNDSVVKDFTKQFIRNGTMISLKDTVIFKKVDNQFGKYSFFPDSDLDRYRVLGVRSFMMKYCDGGKIKLSGIPVAVIAYLFENRIFWENMTFKISLDALHDIESSCNIKWDTINNQWIDLNSKSGETASVDLQ